ncbi:undecaprenyl/decaprenyl-phosphate alpha-N-acetylglucosaminyl 1-phosphate transferase [Clostridium tyrobutyricum]|jgi:UDP-GlcNAc:undecaprenyl-phosphate GlcNAc-1-phosphate transferase|uniref:Undecaprenyl-phosphate N-acetylglucosaminyl 1-phosphate transferase n=1 Tax=Clostridium tyrobutyricum DIVETGP TaxID=1408889 RepID=W6N6Y0_CLOTY|nr:MraY family glycosyltransferase [Clostridium tyrobutyricum]AND83413.1 undecaprenyl-phosphate N-acetylglucosaminyl 1-phosphate transferase [Clostridium tyrobutyricum]ANP68212.1 undecaprenyl-phosphate alpha-N-acetylglucosaminyl 1-phosphate transferase [Clostridium tyrobutyricum]MBR9648876.1 undecaprenyl/decaprenyl-phosphate alpha-N-acetylglucosaminyl 1-phosphate transferase [Clostridium tyrobutyricum]MBV4416261.1 undecaprenyl/decaprenyl-phosphate alpha-N-acetylglucosaminyl 1-phosphate transfer
MNNIYTLAVISILISAVLTPFVKKIAVKLDVIDIPKDSRRVHNKPIPLLGGLAIYFSFIITLILNRGELSSPEKGMIFGATVIVIGGFIDDKYDIKPWCKLLFQILAALILIYFGIRITIITNPVSNIYQYIHIGMFSIPLTIIWVVGITNAMNLIDGLDGLAAGIALIASVTLSIIAILNGRNEAAIVTIIFAGSILGFLPYNFNPASIFMGDTGAQLLGFMLAAISIEGAIKSAAVFPIAVPILAFGIPIYDTLFAVIRRKINGKPIMSADKGHLHHRLLDMGLNQKQAVLIMYVISAILGSFSIIAAEVNPQRAYFLLLGVMVVLIILAWKVGFFKHRE